MFTKPLTVQVPTFDELRELRFEPGRVTFLMGANGTGKSSLMDLIARESPDQVERIYAHRNVTFESSSISVSGAERDHFAQTLQNIFSQPQTRFLNQYANQTVNAHLYDLYVANSAFTARQSERFRSLDPKTPEGLAEYDRIKVERPPFQRLQTILTGAGLRLALRGDERGKILAQQEGGDPYGIQELSDGERAAFLLSASVITAKPDSLFLIDEPERHLHRSISSSLISSLLQDRPDCAFVISTHDVGLSLDHQPSQCVLLRRFRHPGQWEFDIIDDAETIDEGIAEAVLGARRTVLFVEGTRTSLDHGLYTHLYPDVSVRACKSCNEVIQATRGLNRTFRDHRVRAVGVIDGDRRPSEEVAGLGENGVICLPVHDVEAIYYHPTVIELVVHRLGAAGSINAEETSSYIVPAMIAEFERGKGHLTEHAIDRHLRSVVLSRLPTVRDLDDEAYEKTVITREEIQTAYDEECRKFDGHVQKGEASELCAAYPLKKTGARKVVASLLGLGSSQNYENTVRAMVTDNEDAAERIRNLLEPLTEKLQESD